MPTGWRDETASLSSRTQRWSVACSGNSMAG
jgi:hypothetical protein